MAQIYWTGGSGSWGQTGDWGGGVLPGITDSVTIAVAGITVSVGTGVAAAAQTLNVVNSTLNIDGGTLYTVQLATFRGEFEESAGTYTMSGQGATFSDGFDFTGGTIDALSGGVQLFDGGTLSGTLAGAGALDIVAGSAYIDSGFAATIDSIVVGAAGGKLGFNTNFAYSKNFDVLGNGVVDLFGHTLTLKGTSELQGVISNGNLIDSSTATLSSPFGVTTLDNGLTVSVTGTMVQAGDVALGANDSGAKISVGKTGNYQINGNWYLSNPASVAAISNAGQFTRTFGGGTATVDASFTNASTGTVAVDIGTLLLNGLVNSLAGTISGNGTLGIAGGQTTLANKVALNVAAIDQQSGVLVLNHALSYAGAWDMTGGVQNLNAPAAKLTLTGAADFNGGTLTGFGGSVTIDDVAQVGSITIGGPITLDIKGTVDQTSTIAFGESSNPTANIEAGATWMIEGDSDILGFFGLIDNTGSFIDPNGSGDALVQAELISSGTVQVNNSTLTLAGSNALGGTLSGTGLLDLQGYTDLGSGVVITVAQLAVDGGTTYLSANESFANSFIEDGNLGVLDLNGNKFSLGGASSLDGGLLTGGGTLAAAGATVIGNFNIGGGATLAISGSADQSGFVNVAPNSGAGSIDITASGHYTLDDDVNIAGLGNLLNAGVFTASGTGTSQVGATLSSTGTVQVADQLLQLGGGGSFAGSISGAGTLEFSSFVGGSTYDLDTGLSIAAAGWEISNVATLALAANVAYGGQFQLNNGQIDLDGETLSLSGTTTIFSGALLGPGTMTISGSSTLSDLGVSSGAILMVTGTAEQNGNLFVGDQPSGTVPPSAAELLVSSSATYTIDANASISNNGTVAVAGHLIASGNGTSTIGDSVVNTGVIAANLGTLQFLGPVTGSGVFSIGTLGLLQFEANATIASSDFVSFTSGGGGLVLDDPAAFAATLENFSKGDTIGFFGFDAGSLTGTYANGADTHITFADKFGDSVTLTFATAQNLSNFTYGTGPEGLASVHHT